MKIVNVTSTLFAATVLLSAACSKDNKPAPGTDTQEEPGYAKEGLFTKAAYHFKLSDSATAKAWHTDSVYYNSKYQINKVADHNDVNESTIYSFSYNSDGKIAALKVRGAARYGQDYLFYYKDKRIDSFVILDSTIANGVPLIATSKVSYGEQSKLSRIVTRQAQEGGEAAIYTTSYYRNAGGKIDSIKVDYSFEGGTGFRSMQLSGNASPGNGALSSIDPAYQLLLAVREDYYLTSFGTGNLYLHNFLSPEDNIFNDGIFRKPNDLTGQPYKSESSVNINNTIRTYQYFEGSRGVLEEKYGIKFEYFTAR